MHRRHILKINEIFPSIQGEGLRLGEPTLFIRFSLCNLRCNFCDTKYAWQAGKDMTVAQILEKVHKIHASFPAQWVCLTGGEPLLQKIGGLARALKAKGFLIQVETNGTIAPLAGANWHTLSPKPPDYFFHPEFKKKAKEVKLVVTGELDLAILKKTQAVIPGKNPRSPPTAIQQPNERKACSTAPQEGCSRGNEKYPVDRTNSQGLRMALNPI